MLSAVLRWPRYEEKKFNRVTRKQRRLEQTCYGLGESHFLLGDHLLVCIRMCVCMYK